ncbi:MAG TPA: SAM-dependent methyltransferase [Longimicrobium sp.]|nr:SAM-dependent methyltransferase [Longimicrobium sp.]
MSSSVPSATEIPNAARIYNYMLGGSHWFPADQGAADYMSSLVPSTAKWVRMLRDFLQQAARQLHGEGFRHFVDFASGLPTEDHIHPVVPGARVVYSDVDPYTLQVARELTAGLPDVLYLEHDVRQARALLESPRVTEFLGGERRVALGFSGITVFLSPDEIRALLRDLYDWAAPGSRLYITWETRQPGQMTPRLQQFLDMFEQTGSPFHLYTPQEAIEMCGPWRIPAGGLPTVAEFLGLPPGHITDEDREGVGLEFYAGILEKPAG